jgi:hypothetical protein
MLFRDFQIPARIKTRQQARRKVSLSPRKRDYKKYTSDQRLTAYFPKYTFMLMLKLDVFYGIRKRVNYFLKSRLDSDTAKPPEVATSFCAGSLRTKF